LGTTLIARWPVGDSGFDCFTNQGESIVGAWQAGAISRETTLDLFRRGEVMPERRTNEEEVKLVAASRAVSAIDGSSR